MRADLCQALQSEATRRGIPVQCGKRLVSAARTSAGRVVATFEDGSLDDGDLLVGADGIHSVVRRTIDADAPRPQYTGEDVVCGYARKAPVLAPPETFRMIYGKRAFFAYLTTPGGDTWWFTNVPYVVEEMTRMRLELIGLSLTPQHSDARVLDQLIYKWRHSRRIIGKVLVDKYRDLLETGWHLTQDEIQRDVNSLFGGAFTRFCGQRCGD